MQHLRRYLGIKAVMAELCQNPCGKSCKKCRDTAINIRESDDYDQVEQGRYAQIEEKVRAALGENRIILLTGIRRFRSAWNLQRDRKRSAISRRDFLIMRHLVTR